MNPDDFWLSVFVGRITRDPEASYQKAADVANRSVQFCTNLGFFDSGAVTPEQPQPQPPNVVPISQRPQRQPAPPVPQHQPQRRVPGAPPPVEVIQHDSPEAAAEYRRRQQQTQQGLHDDTPPA